MSDDEEYYDFDDDDIFWIEEPEPEIADDLALTATSDALFFDDPSLETQDFYSDWSEVSDDYYDEDPTAVRRQRAMGIWPNKPQLKQPGDAKRKAQRGAASRGKAPSALKPDTTSFRGVVWRTPVDEVKRTGLYEAGDGEKVALLKNWREVFRSSNPANERGRPRKGGAAGKENGRVLRAAADEKKDDVVMNGGEDGTEEGRSLSPPVHAGRVVRSPDDVPVNSKMMEHEFPIDGEEYGHTLELEGRPAEAAPAKRTRASKTNGTAEKSGEPVADPASTVRGRKRKASVSQEQPESTTGPKSKRIASKKVGETADQQPESTGPVRRSTRNRK